MIYDVPSNFAELPSDKKQMVLKTAEHALREQRQVFFNGKQFTNFDELTVYLTEYSKTIIHDADWNGEMTEDYNG